jgi:DNA-directed RNA polymerase subunit M
LVLRRKEGTKDEQLILVCPKCGYAKEAIPQEAPTTTTVATTRSTQEQIAVIGEEEAKIRTMPTMKAECPKCHNIEAYWWMVQTRGADESPTQFFRCTVCGYTWREMA